MLTALVSAVALTTTAPQVVQVPVEDPRLPSGPMEFVGMFGGGRLYVDATSWKRSDLPDHVRGTVIMVTPDPAMPVQVARAWIDCRLQVYQLDAGRAYDGSGAEVARTGPLTSQPIGSAGPVRQLADRVCVTPFTPPSFAAVHGWRAAIDETRAANAAPGEADD
jgi:hypothetical protein